MDLEEEEQEHCHYSGVGSYQWGVEYCEFVCPLRELCEQYTEYMQEREDATDQREQEVEA